MAITFFRLEKFSSMILLKTISGPLSWESSFSSILTILRFGVFIVFWISQMLWVMSVLHFAFSLTVVSISSNVSSIPEILSSVSCIASDNYICNSWPLSRYSISRFASIWIFFIVFTSTFRSWITLFNSFTCLPVLPIFLSVSYWYPP